MKNRAGTEVMTGYYAKYKYCDFVLDTAEYGNKSTGASSFKIAPVDLSIV